MMSDNTSLVARLREKGEIYAAALIEHPDRSPIWRYSYALRTFFAEGHIQPYDGGRLYPSGLTMGKDPVNRDMGLFPDFSFTIRFFPKVIEERVPEALPVLQAEIGKVIPVRSVHTIGGDGYTHSFINYRRILKDGLNGYRRRVEALPEGEFREAMLMVLEGIALYKERCLENLRQADAPQELIDALNYVPDNSPRTIYEALVAWNFAFYFDGCDDLGGLDRGLLPFWNGEDIIDLLRELYRHVDVNDAWSMPLGPDYNSLTVQCILASKNNRRPSIQLLVKEDMPDEIWQAAVESLSSSCGQPAFYNWESYRREFRHRLPQVTEADLHYLAFGGCTETMVEGLSNVGSDDAGINSALIFDEFMRSHLSEYDDFEGFVSGYLDQVRLAIRDIVGILETYRKTRAENRPQPIRTLFVDDCLDRMTDFNAGGARYNWSEVNVAGLINVIDSLMVLKRLVFEEKEYAPDDFIRLLDDQDPVFLARCDAQPKHGNDDPEVNRIARYVSGEIYGEFEKYTCTPGGRYFPVSNQFTTYEFAGLRVRATPDGRPSGAPLNDSCGAVQGRDTQGPTALLNSVAALRLDLVLGTPVTNIRLSRDSLKTLLRPMVEGFFRSGGVQLQVTSASREELLDAVEHPEKHQNLIVRIGGYSEYFVRLTPALQRTVIDRTEY